MLKYIAFAFLGVIIIQGAHINRNRRTGTAEHWCCSVDVAPIRKNVTTIDVEPRQVTKIVNTTYQRDCHFGETPTIAEGLLCEDIVSHVVTTTELVEVNKTVVVEYPGRCPQHYLHCCDGYEKVGSQCLDKGASSSLQELIDAGLLG
ncbi:uncharacterized protein LOC133206222 [Saccostrea echinata]|uniref:uncharacterized protein LOC133206222 n=1 Tax=Saccostrea echinata TaxID=191078 RepID=UPI002A801A51|nr:uncharacterized protein LOC133206222 [Saccostrea echinata]